MIFFFVILSSVLILGISFSICNYFENENLYKAEKIVEIINKTTYEASKIKLNKYLDNFLKTNDSILKKIQSLLFIIILLLIVIFIIFICWLIYKKC